MDERLGAASQARMKMKCVNHFIIFQPEMLKPESHMM